MKKWLCFFIGVVALVAQCKGDGYSNADHSPMAKPSGLSSLQKMMISYIAKKNGYDMRGWVDLKKQVKNTDSNIKLKLQNQKVLCIEGDKVARVTLVKEQFVANVGTEAQFLLYFEYQDLGGNGAVLNPLPLVRENYIAGADGQNVLFPNGFEGYIVCVEAGKEAYLVADKIDLVDFVKPEWEVSVDVQMFRNPLAPYGRMYKIVILDNVEVIKNGKKSFYWHMPLMNMIDVYEFHIVIESLAKGKSCKVLRSIRNGELILRCEKLRKSTTPVLINSYGRLGVFLANVVTLLSPLLAPSLVYYQVEEGKSSDANKDGQAMVTVSTPKIMSGKALATIKPQGKAYLTAAGTRWIVGNSIVLSLWLAAHIILNGTYYKTIKDKMKKMDQELDKAPFAFPWRLEYIAKEPLLKILKNRLR